MKIQNNVSVYSGVVCEDDVFLGPSCVCTNIINPRSEVVRRGEYAKTLVGKGASIGANAARKLARQVADRLGFPHYVIDLPAGRGKVDIMAQTLGTRGNDKFLAGPDGEPVVVPEPVPEPESQ